jgi:Secretion system C-terminal sorting domain
MRKLFFLLLLLPAVIKAQNIVPNSNFTQYYFCPAGYGTIDSCKFWNRGNQGTTDYFNACGSGLYDIPQNYLGYQASPGSAYAGFIAYSQSPVVYKEYIKTKIPALEIGATYKVTIVVSLADSVKFASDGLGVYFYILAKPDSSNFYCLNVTPQIDYTSYGIISDKINWTVLTKNFVADSNYNNLVIGNFRCGSLTNLSTSTYYSANYENANNAYYYLDSVSVEKIANAGLNIVNRNSSLSMYPNPAATSLNIASQDKITSVAITNLFGQTKYTLEYNTEKVQIDLADLPAGIYLIRINGSEVRKFVKE